MFCLIFANLDDSNGWPLVLEEAVMPTEPQPLPYDIKKLNEFHYKEPFVASRSVILNLHCDQIGRFFKVLGYNFVCKRSPNIWWLLVLTSLFNKKNLPQLLFLKSRPISASLCLFSVFFKQTIQILQQIYLKKCPSNIRCQDSNPQLSDYESPSLTTRPGLLPSSRYSLGSFYYSNIGSNCYTIFFSTIATPL